MGKDSTTCHCFNSGRKLKQENHAVSGLVTLLHTKIWTANTTNICYTTKFVGYQKGPVTGIEG